MSRYVQGADRRQQTLLPECLDHYVVQDDPVRLVDVLVDEPDLKGLGFEGMTPAATGRPAYPPAMLLKLYFCSYLDKVQTSRPLERDAQRIAEAIEAVESAPFLGEGRKRDIFYNNAVRFRWLSNVEIAADQTDCATKLAEGGFP